MMNSAIDNFSIDLRESSKKDARTGGDQIREKIGPLGRI